MRKFIVALLLLICYLPLFSQSQLVYQFDIKEEIGPPIWRKVKMAMNEAHELEANAILIQMNTYGGAVDAADSIRTKILESSIPVYVLVENNAASAGALISLACDSIFMKPGSTIGAATVVDQNGEQVPDKYQSYMRKKMRSTAEENGRDPDIAEAMVDPDVVVEGVSAEGKVVTLTVSEAVELGFCEAEYSSAKEVLKHCNIEGYTIVRQKLKLLDHIIGWLINPAISGLLILVIFGGIYFELQSPGVGFPIAAAIAAALLYFMPLYLEGLADNWEILLFVIGLVLIAIEVFVIPGFGVAGVAGISMAVAGLILSLIGNAGFDFSPVPSARLVESTLVVLLSSGISVFVSLFLAIKLFESGVLSRLVLSTEQKSGTGFVGIKVQQADLIGKRGTAHTELMPSGKVEIEGRIFDASAISGFIERGAKIIVITHSGTQLKVEKA